MNKKVLLFIIMLLNSSLVLGQALTGVKICINPGHGGHDPANDRHILETDFWESEGNIAKGLYLKAMLEKLGATVIMTRTTNNDADDLPLSQIVAIANDNKVQLMHSIHSNATGTTSKSNYTLMLYQGTNLTPTYPDSKTMSQFLGAEINSAHRTTDFRLAGDFDFYGTGKAYLGVFKGLGMPGTLSEGSFHDYIPESWRLRNEAYLKHEAWAITKAFLSFWGKPSLTTGIVAGIVRDPDQTVSYTALTSQDAKKPINKVKVTLKAGDPSNTMAPIVYNGDDQNNGFFMFDELAPGQYKLYYEAAGYFSDSSVVTVEASKNTFGDKDLSSSVPPVVVSVSPSAGDSLYPGKKDVVIDFSRIMNRTSVESAISINPQVPLAFTWSTDKKVAISTSALPFNTSFTLTISEAAKESSHGILLDGNKDGAAGDSYSYSFKTMVQDVSAPVVESVFPSNNMEYVDPMPLVNICFNEPINTSTISGRVKIIKNSDQASVAIKGNYFILNNQKSVFSFFPVDTLLENESYSVVLSPGLEDQYKNAISSEKVYTFKTGAKLPAMVFIEKFESGFTTNWASPLTYASGIVNSETNFTASTTYKFYGSSSSMQLNYSWDKNAASWFLREYLSSGTPKTVTFSSTGVLQTYVFGDGSRNKFRFCVADESDFSGLEVSPWYTVDWTGWKLVGWNMSKDGLGVWDGNTKSNGTLNGPLKFDSFQLTYTPGNQAAGFLCFDNLRAANVSFVGVEKENGTGKPSSYALDQNYPNPFNPSTTLSYQIPGNSFVSLKVFDLLGREVATLVNKEQTAGKYKVQFNASNIPSGIYIYMLRTDNYKETKKMVLLK
ncbi:MAG: Ig-like domain-containing protein [Syntrophomonadaceae bacterium]